MAQIKTEDLYKQYNSPNKDNTAENNSIMSNEEMNKIFWPYINMLIQTSLFYFLNFISIYSIFYFHGKELVQCYLNNTFYSSLKSFFNPFVLIPFIFQNLLPITVTYTIALACFISFSVIRTYLNNIQV